MKILFKSFSCLIIILLASVKSFALNIDDSSIENKNVFGLIFPDGNSYYGLADQISNVSIQSYIAGPLAITEVSINLSGSPVQLRIYNAKANTANNINAELKKNLPENLKPYAEIPNNIKDNSKLIKTIDNSLAVPLVVKDYPMTTHAKTIEFVVQDLDELMNFYKKFVSDYTGSKNDTYNTENTNSKKGARIRGRLYKIGEDSKFKPKVKKEK